MVKKLFEPQDSRELLKGWLIHANKGREKHERAARHLASRYQFIG